MKSSPHFFFFFETFTLPSTLDIWNAYISNVDTSHVTLSPQIWNLKTLKLWKLHLKFSLFALAPSKFDISNVGIFHITLSPQIWNLEALKRSLQIFAVFPCLLKLTFRILTYSTLLCHEAFLLSKKKCVVLKYEICRFQMQKCVNFKYEKVSISNMKTRNFQKREMCHFQILKMHLF